MLIYAGIIITIRMKYNEKTVSKRTNYLPPKLTDRIGILVFGFECKQLLCVCGCVCTQFDRCTEIEYDGIKHIRIVNNYKSITPYTKV